MKKWNVLLIAPALAFTVSLAAGYPQDSGHDHAAPSTAPGATMDRAAMMANMEAEQKKLDELVAQMNAATGPDKVNRIAAVVNELAATHRRMSGMMMMMMRQGNMMQMPRGGQPQPAQPAPKQPK
jgi:hypothetical protein